MISSIYQNCHSESCFTKMFTCKWRQHPKICKNNAYEIYIIYIYTRHKYWYNTNYRNNTAIMHTKGQRDVFSITKALRSTSIRHWSQSESVGSMSNQCQSEDIYYLGHLKYTLWETFFNICEQFLAMLKCVQKVYIWLYISECSLIHINWSAILSHYWLASSSSHNLNI